MTLALKIIFTVIFLIAFGFSVWLNVANYRYWGYVQSAPVNLMKNRLTGDVVVQVPYSKEPFMFRRVCSPEQIL